MLAETTVAALRKGNERCFTCGNKNHLKRDCPKKAGGGRREEGSGWGTRVYLWRIHVDIWQNQYNIVKLKNKIKKKGMGWPDHKKKKKIIWDCNFGAPVSYMNLDTQNPFQIPITVKFSGIISLNKLSQETLSSATCTSIERKKVNSLSRVQLFATPWTVAYQDPLSMGFSRQ